MNDNNQLVVKTSMWHQHSDAAQWQHHRIKRNKDIFSKCQQLTGDNSKQATTAVASRAQMQGQPQQHCGTCCRAACNGIMENFKLKGNNQLVALQQFCCNSDDVPQQQEADNNQWTMATELWCQWWQFLHQLLCCSEQWLIL